MTKNEFKFYLDFVPIIILTVSAIILVWTVATTDTAFLWKHYVGLVALPLNYFFFLKNHKVGVIGLGLTLFIGLLSFLSFNQSVTTSTYFIYIGDTKIPVFYGQTIFLLWLLIHFILSGRYYVGIVTKKYWQDFLKNSDTQTGT